MAPGLGLDRQPVIAPRPSAAWRSALCRHENVRIGLWAVNVLLILGDVIDQAFRTLWHG